MADPQIIKIAAYKDKAYLMPTKASSGSAAYDVLVPCHYKLQYGRQIIPLGWCCEMPADMALDIRTRSGYAAKGILAYDVNGHETRIDADVKFGLIDSDYRGEVGVILQVRDERVRHATYYLGFGQAIAQMKFCQVPATKLATAKEPLSETSRGTHGFGQHNGE